MKLQFKRSSMVESKEKLPNNYCKQYFEQGFCKFGQDCKFQHLQQGGFQKQSRCKNCGSFITILLISCNCQVCKDCQLELYKQKNLKCIRCERMSNGLFK
uniref:Cysteine-rich protein n=1 Tax=Spironucleus salmonicida TaxID=348837 RepID=V6LCQ1_9EUKA|eukprot:EST42260.1 Cysteine-rich protein [Spironucleus salmonicida]